MNIIVGENINRTFIEDIMRIIDEELDGSLSTMLKDATVYIVTGNGDRISLDVVKHLVEAGLVDRANAFISAMKRGTDVASFIPDGNGQIVIIKIDVDGNDGWYAVPIEVLVMNIMSALEHGGIINQQPRERMKGMLKAIVDYIVDEKNACLHVEHVPGYYS